MRRIGLLLYLTLVHIIALLLFSNGFLLTRISLDDTSPAEENGVQRTFEKAVILVIDALRYDFIVPQNETSPYWNHFTRLSTIAKDKPRNALLTKFLADPPTTTLQRLKGLTTGSLPTFVDAGSNFAGEAITEDNLILQLGKASKRIAFVGDDTWQALFPQAFVPELNHPFESLNVWDLDTVDDGVYHHLLDPDQGFLTDRIKPKWDIVIAHALGVDHAGHRYGPNHPETTRKLLQMNDWVEEIIQAIDDDTLLVIMGDHGMNPQGDHGGDSVEELEAGLFMYSHQETFSAPLASRDDDLGVAQIDFVPTFALLMGLPIPFNNLGSPIPQVFARNPNVQLDEAVQRTSRQLRTYIDVYAKQSASIKESLEEVDAQFPEQHDPLRWQRQVLEVFRRQWAQYHMLSIICGLTLMLTIIIFLITTTYSSSTRIPLSRAVAALISVEIVFMIVYIKDTLPRAYSMIGCPISLALYGLVHYSTVSTPQPDHVHPNLGQSEWTATDIISMLVLVLHCATFASNSFTIHEDRISLFLLATLAVTLLLRVLRHAGDLQTQLQSAGKVLLFMVLARLAATIRLCREEQAGFCESNFYDTSPFLSLSVYLILAVILILVVQNTSSSPRTTEKGIRLWKKYGVAYSIALSWAYWVLEKMETLPFLKLTMARCIMLTGVGQLLAWYWSPLPIDFRLVNGVLQAVRIENLLALSYLQLILPLLSILIFLGRGLGSVSIMLLILQLLLLTSLFSSTNLRKAPRANLLAITMLIELAFLHFFSTGHQMGLPFIQWDLAFLVSRSIVYPISPLLVIGNTFGSFIVVALWIPVFILWRSPVPDSARSDSGQSGDGRSDSPRDVEVTTASLMFVLAMSCITLSTMFFATHFRRHLMVWKIFAPRFMSASLVLLIVDIVLIFSSVGISLRDWKVAGIRQLLDVA